MIKKLRIVFIGTPEFAVSSLRAILDADFDVAAVITAPDKPSGRGLKLQFSPVKEFALAQGLKVLQPTNLKNPDFIHELADLKHDLQVVIAFRMLPELVWNLPPLGTINLHASLLPDYRGAAPINRAIMNGETKTGLTTFKLKHAIDTGDLLLQKEVEIGKSETAGQLHDKMMNIGADLMVKTLEGLETGALVEIPQKLSDGHHHAPKIFKEDCEIDWNQNGKAIFNQIRGLCPYPTARTRFQTKVLKIYAANFHNQPTETEPGTFTSDGKHFLRYSCSDGFMEILELQLEGKKKMNVEEFLRGVSI